MTKNTVSQQVTQLAETLSPPVSDAARKEKGAALPVCPMCKGKKRIRSNAPLGHKDFGKTLPCVCLSSEVEAEQRQALYRHSGLPGLASATFDNFIPSGRAGISAPAAESLRAAYDAAQAYARQPLGWIVLQGGVGCGKTHLAAAIANAVVAGDTAAYFETAPDLLDRLRAHFGDSEEHNFTEAFERIRNAPLLVLDDLGTENQTPWAVEKLFQILNYRYTNRLPTVITTNVPLDRIEARIRSRMQDDNLSLLIEIKAPDYRQGARSAAPAGKAKKVSGGWMADKTFANFTLRADENLAAADLTAIEHAVSAAKNFAKRPSGFLLLAGPSWSGKTHLLSAIANQRSAVEPVRYYSMHDLIDFIRASYDSKEEGDGYLARMDELKTAPLLLIDDFDFSSATPWGRDRIVQIVNYRHANRLPTVVATARPLRASAEFPINQRLLDPGVSKVCNLRLAYPMQKSNKGIPTHANSDIPRTRKT